MKKRINTLLFLLIFPLIGFGQSYYYNFDEDGNLEGFNQGGIPSLNVTGGSLVATDNPDAYSGGFQQIRTPEGLNLVETSYTVVRLVVENLLVDNTGAAVNHETFRIVNYDTGDNSAGNATQSSNITIPYGSGFQTLDFAIPSNPDNGGTIDRIGLRVQLNSAGNLSGTLKIDQFIIVNTITVNIANNGDFENNGGELTPWVANGSDVSAFLTTGNGGGSAGRLAFNQNATGNNTIENSFYTFTDNQEAQTLTVNFDAKTSSVSGATLGVQVSTKLDGGVTENAFNGNEAITSSWASYSINRSVNSFDEIRVSLRVKNNVASASLGDTYDFDNVVVNVSYYNLTPATSASTTDGNWSDSSTWIAGYIPTSSDNVVINHNVSIDTNADTKDLTINSGGTLSITSGSTLIVSGTSTGNVTYNRTLATTNWYLMSPPVSGVTFNDAFVTANNIASGTIDTNNRGVASYNPGNTGAAAWTYLQSAGTMNASAGSGYSIKQSTAGDVAFTGTINTADVTTASLATGFNLLGNPYTSYVNSATFLADAANTNIDQTQVWVWNQSLGDYEVKTSGDAFVLAPGQGFFVNVTSAGTVTFTESNQTTTGNAFQKTNRTEVKLNITDGERVRYAKLYFADNFTNGFDYGWEGEVFGGISNNLQVFTNLLAQNEGKKYQVQSLSNTDYENTVVPVGLVADAGKEITFSAETINFPAGLKVFLEDRETNTMTRIDEANTSYKVTLDTALNGTGRFYLHTKSAALSTDDVALAGVNIYTINKNTLRVSGINSGNAAVKVFNILGKKVVDASFASKGTADINLPNLNAGVYIVQLSTEKGKTSKKIVLE